MVTKTCAGHRCRAKGRAKMAADFGTFFFPFYWGRWPTDYVVLAALYCASRSGTSRAYLRIVRGCQSADDLLRSTVRGYKATIPAGHTLPPSDAFVHYSSTAHPHPCVRPANSDLPFLPYSVLLAKPSAAVTTQCAPDCPRLCADAPPFASYFTKRPPTPVCPEPMQREKDLFSFALDFDLFSFCFAALL